MRVGGCNGTHQIAGDAELVVHVSLAEAVGVGTVAMRTHIAPRMGYGKDIPTLRSAGGRLVAAAGGDELWVSSDVNPSEADRSGTGEFIITVGERSRSPLQAFLATGYLEEAEAWRDWLMRTVTDNPSDMQIMYAVDSSRDLAEHTLDWPPGHAHSRPVQVGNGAAIQ